MGFPWGQATLKTGNSDAYGNTSDRHTSIGCRAGQSSHLEVSEGGNPCDYLDRKSMLTCICFLTSSVGLGATCQVGLGATYVKAKDPIFKASPGRQRWDPNFLPISSPWLGSVASPTPRWLTKNLLAPISYTSITPATLFLVVLKPRQARFSCHVGLINMLFRSSGPRGYDKWLLYDKYNCLTPFKWVCCMC